MTSHDGRAPVQGRIDRREFVNRLLRHQDDLLVIAGLGGAGYDCTVARGDHDLNFCLHGAMGGAPAMAMGLALAQPNRRVVAVMGDGDFLMGVGTLATIMSVKPTNLAIVVLDNGVYAETGNQLTGSGYGVDIAGMAKAAGFPLAMTVDESNSDSALYAARERDGPIFLRVMIAADSPPSVPKTRDGVYMKMRFRKALLGVNPE